MQSGQRPGPPAAAWAAVSATFTADLLKEPLSFWLGRLALDLPVRFAPYNQVFQQLLDPASLLAQNRGGVNIVLVRLEDWVRFQDTSPATLESVEENARYLVSCLRAAAESFSSPLLVSVCPSSPGFLAGLGRIASAERMVEQIESGLRGVGTVHFIGAREIDHLYPVAEKHDPHGDTLGHIPYTPEYFTALGTLVARKIHTLRTTPYKVVALDCDDTLWQGICGEDGPEGVVVDPPRHALQEFMVKQHDSGMLLCLCSKNNPQDVLETFRAHPGMPLRLEHFVAQRINWTAKSANLASLAEELQLGLDSFIFVDDNPQECAEVQARRPEVLTLPLPANAGEIPSFLDHVWAFDRVNVTEEDKHRTALYAQHVERAQLEKQAKTLEEFITSLQLDIRVEAMTPDRLPRVAQLTQRTSQMNFTTIRRTEADIQALLRSGAECLTVEVSDRFGSYGLTGVAIFNIDGEVLRVDTFLLSCRVLGRGVEHHLMASLGEIASQRGLRRVYVPFFPTQRNHPALLFLENVAAQFKEPAEGGFLFRIPSSRARAISYQPASAVPHSQSPAASGQERAREHVDFVYIASNLRSVEQIQLHMRHGNRNGAAHAATQARPRTELEQQLAAVWAELLGVPSIGIHDNFFDLGGHSLLAVQLLSRVRQAYQVDLSLDVVYSSAFTVAELAKAIEVRMIEQAGAGEYASILADLEGLSDHEVRALLDQEMEASESEGGR